MVQSLVNHAGSSIPDELDTLANSPHCRDVPRIRAAAAADQAKVRQVGSERVLRPDEVNNVAGVEFGRRV